jgi:hypothetical protein
MDGAARQTRGPPERKPVHQYGSKVFPIAIVSGVACVIGKRNVTLVAGPRGRAWVHWFDHELPPGVAVGRDVLAYGRLLTMGNARSFRLVDAVLIRRLPKKQLSEGLSNLLEGFIVEPPSKGEAKPNGHGV